LQSLILLANEGTDTGRILAAHALAKIAITQNPEIAFPGQRVSAAVNISRLFELTDLLILLPYSLFISVSFCSLVNYRVFFRFYFIV